MRRATLAAALLLILPAIAHTPPSAFQCTGCGGFTLAQWTSPTGPCETLWHGSATKTTGDAKPVHAEGLLGPVVLGDLDIRYAAAEQWVRTDDPTTPGACGSAADWVTLVHQEERFESTPLSSFGSVATIDVTWTAYTIQAYATAGYTPSGTCTLVATLTPPIATTTVAPISPTGTCTFTVGVPPAPASVTLDLHADAWLSASTPFFPLEHYLKAHVEVADATHHDTLAHCVEAFAPSPC